MDNFEAQILADILSMTSIKKERTELVAVEPTLKASLHPKNMKESYCDGPARNKRTLQDSPRVTIKAPATIANRVDELELEGPSIIYKDTRKFMDLLENGNVSHQFIDLIPLQSEAEQQRITVALIPYF